MKNSIKKQSGFTLMELLVVIFIIGVLTSIATVSLRNATEKAKIARAQADLNALAKGIDLLCDDTGRLPSNEDHEVHSCFTCEEFDKPAMMDECMAGLGCNDGYMADFPGWRGPYVSYVPLDPWGRQYWLDFDFICSEPHGCTGNNKVRALRSAGPNKSFSTGGNELDDIIYVLCDY